MNEITVKIIQILNDNKIDYKEVDHGPAPTCDISAKNRGESIAIGGKTLLLKDKVGFNLFVISAVLQVDNQKIRKLLNSQKLRFATKDELMELCGVVTGALAPIGRPLYNLDLYIDKSVLNNEKIAFNAGILTKSLIINIEDYKRLVTAIECEFSK
jgi:Ala-tRNA(Pro) deacylase